jgi:hypothetical protein
MTSIRTTIRSASSSHMLLLFPGNNVCDGPAARLSGGVRSCCEVLRGWDLGNFDPVTLLVLVRGDLGEIKCVLMRIFPFAGVNLDELLDPAATRFVSGVYCKLETSG